MAAKKTSAPKAETLAVARAAGRRSSTARKSTATKAAKKTATKKTAAKKTATKETAAKKTVAKAVAKKPAATNAVESKPAAKKAASKAAAKRTASKAAAKRTASKAVAKKAVAKKTASDTKVAKRAPAKVAARKAATTLAVRSGERPWTVREIAEVRAMLESDEERLEVEISAAEEEIGHLLREGGEGAGHDQADVGSNTFERDHEMSMAKNARDNLVLVKDAIARIDDGTYGVCESCGEPIGKMRLQAFPRATLCMECKQRQERR